MRKYKGLFGSHARRRCPHTSLVGIHGDEIIMCGWWRLYCIDCERLLDGPVSLAQDIRSDVEYIDVSCSLTELKRTK